MDIKSNKKNFYFIMIVTFVIMAVVLKKDFFGVISVLGNANIFWLMFSAFLMFIYWMLEAGAYYLIFKQTAKKVGFWLIAKVTLATQFFNGVTPFASGGQPFQIYVLNKKTKIGYGKVTSTSLKNFIVYQTSLVIFGFIAVFVHLTFGDMYITTTSHVNFVIFTGFMINFAVIAGLVLVSKYEKLSRFILINGLNFLHKIKLVKNVEQKRNDTKAFLEEFHEDINSLSEHQWLFTITLILNLVKLIIFYSLSYTLCLAVGVTEVKYISVVLASAYTMLLTSLVPLPGASGGAEIGFLAFFGGLVSVKLATVIMLLWRFYTYYIGLGLGFLTFTFGFRFDDDVDKKLEIDG